MHEVEEGPCSPFSTCDTPGISSKQHPEWEPCILYQYVYMAKNGTLEQGTWRLRSNLWRSFRHSDVVVLEIGAAIRTVHKYNTQLHVYVKPKRP